MGFVIINARGLFFMQMGLNDYSFTTELEQATRFFAEENALLKIRKMPTLTGLSVKKIKNIK